MFNALNALKKPKKNFSKKHREAKTAQKVSGKFPTGTQESKPKAKPSAREISVPPTEEFSNLNLAELETALAKAKPKADSTISRHEKGDTTDTSKDKKDEGGQQASSPTTLKAPKTRALISNPITVSRGLPYTISQFRPVQAVRCEAPTRGTFNIKVEASRGLSYAVEESKLVEMVRWEAPPCGTCKINVDGSFITKSREAGIGGLIRNSNGQWIFGFSEPVKVETILHVELLAIKKGLELAWNKGCRNVICETDSKDSLKLIKRASTNVHMFRKVIGEIQKICERKWERVELVHVLREGNQCADYLAKFGSKQPLFSLDTFKKQLEDDASGTFYFRKKKLQTGSYIKEF
ncbi:hypothetical protein QN277_025008 [Acacia crassicarpa]|nr:hypothetical protein QN277_025008 [Acacia crassicarpa]